MEPFSTWARVTLAGIFLAGTGARLFGQQPIYTAGKIYEETRIRATAYPLGNGPFNETGSFRAFWLNGTVPFGKDGFVGLATTIHSDSRAEAFPAHRMNAWPFGMDQLGQTGYRLGAWVEYFRFDGSDPHFLVNAANRNQETFFTRSFPRAISFTRRFQSSTYNRGYSKVEYVCPGTCGTSNVSSYYFKIGSWNMSDSASKRYPMPSSALLARDIVNMEAVIHSDGNDNEIIVDKLNHIAKPTIAGSTNPDLLGKGGNIWYGYGCMFKPCNHGNGGSARIVLFGGAFSDVTPRSSYRGANFKWQGSDDASTLPYTSLSRNRGWVKMEFYDKAVPQTPYAIKSKALAIGDWDMHTQEFINPIPLSAFGISANRIVGMNTTIQSDPKNGASIDAPGWQLTDFNMHPWESPQQVEFHPSGGGGVTLVRGGNLHVVSTKRAVNPTEKYNYYTTDHSLYKPNGGTYNRGWVKLDYLAGSCEQGPSGFKIIAVPGAMTGTCTGTSQPFNIEGAGRGFQQAATDSFTFVYKQINDFQATITVRIEGRDANTLNDALSGVTFRTSLDANSPHASLLVSKATTNGLQWWSRPFAGPGNTNPTKINAPSGAFWIRIKKSGGDCTAFYHTSSSTSAPSSGWSQFPNIRNISISSNFYVGLVVSNSTGLKLAKTTFRNVSVTSP